MAGERTAWGIEIGAQALKALRLERQGDQVQIADFSYIPHKKVLSTPDVDSDEVIRLAIGQFVSQRPDLGDGAVVVSVPGNAAFARFAKLPPVEPKKVPDIVKFEAVQQIPFPIDEVEWDFQTFASPDSPDVEVGIFAITKANIAGRIALYREIGLFPDGVTLAPVSTFNAMQYDLDLGEDVPGIIILDIGTTSTDLIIAEEGRTWVRTFPSGGHTFTEALIETFKLTYSKAEKTKAEAQTSKYRRQILNALRPVFSDLAQEVQRSIGYYQSTHPNANLTKLVGVGSTFKLPGLRKFLSQQLQMEVVRLDEFQKIKPSGRGAELFSNHAVNFASAYGLALQGLGLADIDVNLIPVSVVRDRLWANKIKWFGAAAALVVFGSLLSFARPVLDGRYSEQPPEFENDIKRIIDDAKALKGRFEEIQQETDINAKAGNIIQTLDHRDVWKHMYSDLSQMLASGNPQPELFSGDPDLVSAIPPAQRRVLDLVSFDSEYPTVNRNASSSRTTGASDSDSGNPIVRCKMVVETPNAEGVSFINSSILNWLRNNQDRDGVPYRLIVPSGSSALIPGAVMVVPGGDEPVGDSARGGRQRGDSRSGRGDFGGKGGEYGFSEGGDGMVVGEGGIIASTGGRFPSSRNRGNNAYMNVGNLDQLAPLPDPIQFLPPGTKYNQYTITWEMEILPPDQAADEETDKEVKG